jgi:hypothetical protein
VTAGDQGQVIPKVRIQWALERASLPREALTQGHHPDTGRVCMVLDATIRQYSLFLVALTEEYGRRAVDIHFDLDGLCDTVQMESRSDGDVRFWLPGLKVAR